LDSSLVASIVSRHAAKMTADEHLGWWPKVHSFSIGLESKIEILKIDENN